MASRDAIEVIGLPEAEYALTHATVAMCQAGKSRNIAETTARIKNRWLQNYPDAEVPLHLRKCGYEADEYKWLWKKIINGKLALYPRKGFSAG
jgi:replication-associated recombination protein RarA